MTSDQAFLLLASFNEQSFYGGVAPDLISRVQEKLGLVFPKDYVEYLSLLGAGYASSEEFFGLGGSSHLDVVEAASLLRKPSKQRSFPKHYIPLKTDGFGNYECIDTARSSDDKSEIVFWVHDAGDSQETELIASGFWSWFVKELESVKDFDAAL